MEIIYDYTQHTIGETIGLMVLLIPVLLTLLGLCIKYVYWIVCRVRLHIEGIDDTATKEYVKAFGISLASVAVMIVLLCEFVPVFYGDFNRMYKQNTGDCVMISGEASIEVYRRDYRGTPLYRVVINIGDEQICADNVFSEKEYKLLCENLSNIQIEYLPIEPHFMYLDEETTLIQNATVLKIKTIKHQNQN